MSLNDFIYNVTMEQLSTLIRIRTLIERLCSYSNQPFLSVSKILFNKMASSNITYFYTETKNQNEEFLLYIGAASIEESDYFDNFIEYSIDGYLLLDDCEKIINGISNILKTDDFVKALQADIEEATSDHIKFTEEMKNSVSHLEHDVNYQKSQGRISQPQKAIFALLYEKHYRSEFEKKALTRNQLVATINKELSDIGYNSPISYNTINNLITDTPTNVIFPKKKT